MIWIAAAANAASPQYQIFDLGVIQAGDTASQGFGVSPGGVSIGRSIRSNASQAFSWTVGGGLVGLPNLAGRNHAVANDANDNGIVVGTAATTLFGSSRLPVIWNNGAVSQLPLPAGETLGDANGVNASGIAVGSVDGGSLQQAVIYNGATATVITATTSTGCFFVTAFGINDSGLIVGQGIDPNNAARNVGMVFRMQPPFASEVGALPGANGALAFAVSNGGHVVGSSMMNQGSGLPFIWTSATGMVAIPLASGTSQGSARGVNSGGSVVGQDSSAFSIPFLWDGTTTYRLADLLPAASGWDLDMNTSSSALGISENGVIVGTGVHNGETHAYAMVPTPGPATHFQVVAPSMCIRNQPCSFTVTARDQFNTTVTGYAGTVHFTSSDGAAELPADGTLTNGTGSRTATFHTEGSQTITATDTVTPSVTGTSNPIQVFHVDPTATPTPTASPSPTPSATPTPTPPLPTSDYAINMTDAPDPVEVGHQLTYTITVSNTGPDFGTNVPMTDTLPAGVTFVSVTPSQGNCTGTSTITCQLGVVITSATVTLVVTPTATGQLSNTATVSYAGDPNASNNSATAMTTVIPSATPTPSPTPPWTPTPGPEADIGVFIQDSPDPVTVGQNLTYTIFVGNSGPSSPMPVTMIDNLDPSVNLVSVTPSQGSCTSTSQIICNLGNLGSATVTVVVTPTQPGLIGNGASAQTNMAHDPAPGNNFDSESTMVLPGATPTPTATASPTPAQALNLATRMRVQSGDNVGIGGFIISGTPSAGSGPSGAAKTVAIRGVGPSLAAFGISDFLADPTLELRNSSGALLKPNDNWQDDPADAAQLSAHNLALQDPKESGLVSTLQPGASYTAILAGKNQGTGVGLIEIYDISQTAGSELANISTRGFVLNGNNVMIGGFILGSGSNTRVVVRGIGPSLAQFGLNPVLTDPTLELHDSNGATLISNNDWQDDSASAALVTSLGLAPQNSKEAAIAPLLAPGAFTAILAGANGGTGIGLVEIYNVH